jgi:T5SS/PEP-CTERM-associated repeat protein
MKPENSHAVSGILQPLIWLFVLFLTLGFGAAHADVTFTGDVTPDPSSGNVGNLFVGGSPPSNVGTGTVTVDNTGTITTLSSTGTFLGFSTGSNGAATVNTGGTWTDNNFFTIGLAPGSTGYLLVTGTNAKAVGAGNVTNVGFGGTGSLTINDGGAFEALFLNVGRTNGAIGTMNVDGVASSVLLSGSNGSSGAYLTVGREGGSQGTAHYTNGAQVNIQNFADTNNAYINVGRSIGSNGTINVSGGAAINVTGNGTAAYIGRGGTGVLNVFDGGKVGLGSAGNATVQIGRDGGNGTVTINGTGSQLTVQSTTGSAIVHVGDGTISTGMLDVKNGGMVSAQEVVVNTNGTLTGGGGMISALVTVNGGTVAPGNSPGTMTIDGDLAFNSGTLDIEIGEFSSDFLHVTGAASFLAGTFAFSFLDGFLPTAGSSWLFLTADDGLSGWEGLNLAVSGLNSSYSWLISQEGNSLNFNVAAVPELESYAMLGVGLGLMGWVGRRKKLQAA